MLLDGETAPAAPTCGAARVVSKGGQQTTKLTITLAEGRNRQIRRMCAQIGHPVRPLTRVRMGPIRLAICGRAAGAT